MDTYRQQFRLYLEKSGVIDALSHAIMKLYKEPNKPDDAVRYIRKYICDECPLEEEYEILKADHIETLKIVADLEEQINRYKGNTKLTEEEIIQTLNDGFKKLTENEECKSLLKKYLTEDLLTQMRSFKTAYGATILDCIQSGLKYFESDIGIYAADPECYSTFHSIFQPIILDYFGKLHCKDKKIQKSTDWGDPSYLRNLDPEGQHVVYIRICISRNLDGYPFLCLLKEDELKEIEVKVQSIILTSLDDQFKGNYLTVKEIDPELYSQMVHKQTAFEKRNKILESAGGYRFWPIGRGIFLTSTENIIVWVNAEDHIKIISTEKTADIAQVYQRLLSFMKFFNDSLVFACNDCYGYLTFSPKNLGTGLEISARIKLPNLIEDKNRLNALLTKLNLEIIKTDAIKIKTDEIVEITMKRSPGPTEFECVKLFEKSILELLAAEKKF